jgi:hypothetical protein
MPTVTTQHKRISYNNTSYACTTEPCKVLKRLRFAPLCYVNSIFSTCSPHEQFCALVVAPMSFFSLEDAHIPLPPDSPTAGKERRDLEFDL